MARKQKGSKKMAAANRRASQKRKATDAAAAKAAKAAAAGDDAAPGAPPSAAPSALSSRRSGSGGTVSSASGSSASSGVLDAAALSALDVRAPPRGLVNLGNTCFFNSALQNVLRLPGLRDQLLGAPAPVCEGPVTAALRQVMAGAWETTPGASPVPGSPGKKTRGVGGGGGGRPGLRSGVAKRGALNPGVLLDAVGVRAPRFRGRQQQDAHELLRALLDAVAEEEVARLKKKAAVVAALAGRAEALGSAVTSEAEDSGETPAQRSAAVAAVAGDSGKGPHCELCGACHAGAAGE